MDISSTFVGGSHWLNLVNTIYMSNGEKNDVLKNPETAQEWLVLSGLLDQTKIIEDIESLINRMVELRQICIRILSDLETRKIITDSIVNDLNKITTSLTLFPSIFLREATLDHSLKGYTPSDEVLYQIIASITETFHTVSLDRIRKCEHDECILYFVDTSKAGKRRWCSMETCGNRKKASTFYARKKQNKD